MINWHPELFLDWAYCMLVVGATGGFLAFVMAAIYIIWRAIFHHGEEE